MDYQPQIRDKIIAILRQDMLKVAWREDRADEILNIFVRCPVCGEEYSANQLMQCVDGEIAKT